MYKIAFSKQADRALRKMPRNTALVIARKIKELAENPVRMRNIKKLTYHPGYRMMVGDWRILYTVHERELLIRIVGIKPRGEAYR